MNTRAVNSAAGVIHAAMKTRETAAGIAMAVEAAGLLMSPETAAELARLRAGAVPLADDRFAEVRARVEATEDGWHIVTDPDDPYRFEIHGDGPTTVAVFGGDSYLVRENAEFAAHARADVPALLAEVDRLRAERHSTNEALSEVAEAVRAKDARIAELEQQLAAAVESPLAWAEQLDAKSLDNFLISLGQAVEYEPMDGAISYIHELLWSFRVAVAARGGEHRG